MNEEEAMKIIKDYKYYGLVEEIDEDWKLKQALEIILNNYDSLKLMYEQNLKFLKHFRTELNKQDKIIDEMAKIIFTVIQGGELPLKILHKHLVRKICDKKFEECFMEDIECEECIKQYFEMKIEK